AIARTIRAHNPDVAVLVEAWPPVGQMTGSLRETLPEFRWSSCAGGLLVLVRGEMESAHYGQLDGGGKFRVCQLTLAGTPLTVVAVDMPNSFNRFRRVPLEALAELVEPLADKPLLVLGDFNTPPDSVHFAHLREVLVNAYEVAGRGYGPTWPVPCPVLTLDQAWASDTIRVLSCRAFWTPYSDHRPLLVSFTPRPSAPAGKN
ncbi:MAG: endonuclease/exonuclease/phosphatase family protein, partial [Planctomycetes bacterium]|nr:endonuclease/exonuclease/phosphatase family protein [Planctomycetota bacterium]